MNKSSVYGGEPLLLSLTHALKQSIAIHYEDSC